MPFWDGLYWGLLSSFFQHVSTYHLAMNMIMIYRLGFQVEKSIGWVAYLALWLVSTSLASLAELSLTGVPGAGASGFLYALFGFRLIGCRGRPELEMNYDTIRALVIWFIICIGLTYSGLMAVANGAHGGGFLVGCLCAYGFLVNEEKWAKPATATLLALLFFPCFYAPWISKWNLLQAEKAYGAHQYQRALDYLSHVDLPDYVSLSLVIRVESLMQLGRTEEMMESLKMIEELAPGEENPLADKYRNEYAWILATSPKSSIQDPKAAVRIATMACNDTAFKDPEIIDTLAVAYAADNQFDEAMKWEQKAADLDSDPSNQAQYNAHLELFRQQKPYLETPKPQR